MLYQHGVPMPTAGEVLAGRLSGATAATDSRATRNLGSVGPGGASNSNAGYMSNERTAPGLAIEVVRALVNSDAHRQQASTGFHHDHVRPGNLHFRAGDTIRVLEKYSVSAPHQEVRIDADTPRDNWGSDGLARGVERHATELWRGYVFGGDGTVGTFPVTAVEHVAMKSPVAVGNLTASKGGSVFKSVFVDLDAATTYDAYCAQGSEISVKVEFTTTPTGIISALTGGGSRRSIAPASVVLSVVFLRSGMSRCALYQHASWRDGLEAPLGSEAVLKASLVGNSRAVHVDIIVAGAGYMSGVLSFTGGKCIFPPAATYTASFRGAITSVILTDPGECVVAPANVVAIRSQQNTPTAAEVLAGTGGTGAPVGTQNGPAVSVMLYKAAVGGSALTAEYTDLPPSTACVLRTGSIRREQSFALQPTDF
jgi:hypothetical protein